MINTMKFDMGKGFYFSKQYPNTPEATRAILEEYNAFTKKFVDKYGISDKWQYPIIYINNKPVGEVAPNGTFDLIRNQQRIARIMSFIEKTGKLPKDLRQLDREV